MVFKPLHYVVIETARNIADFAPSRTVIATWWKLCMCSIVIVHSLVIENIRAVKGH